MNDVTKPDPLPSDEWAFANYVYAIGAALGVPAEMINYDFSDTVEAYLPLAGHSPVHPGRDVALLWSVADGWTLALDAQPGESSAVLAEYTSESMPAPAALAPFLAARLDTTA